jgi:hypothetical protein
MQSPKNFCAAANVFKVQQIPNLDLFRARCVIYNNLFYSALSIPH